MNLHEKLAEIQKKINAPKSQFNSFGKYSYRNLEDIMEGFKEVSNGTYITISDEIHVVSQERVYIKATATISDGKESISTVAYAREPIVKKGMDESQITGATSSYAGKYALGRLLAIDDSKDADSMDNSKQQVIENKIVKPEVKKEFTDQEKSKARDKIVDYCEKLESVDSVEKLKLLYQTIITDLEKYSGFDDVDIFLKNVVDLCKIRKLQLEGVKS